VGAVSGGICHSERSEESAFNVVNTLTLGAIIVVQAYSLPPQVSQEKRIIRFHPISKGNDDKTTHFAKSAIQKPK